MDVSQIGKVAAEAMDELFKRYPEGRVRDVVIVTEVDNGDGTPTRIAIQSTEDRPRVLAGLLFAAGDSAEFWGTSEPEEDIELEEQVEEDE